MSSFGPDQELRHSYLESERTGLGPHPGVEDLRRAEARQRLLEGIGAEGRVHRIRQPPRRGPVHGGHFIAPNLTGSPPPEM